MNCSATLFLILLSTVGLSCLAGETYQLSQLDNNYTLSVNPDGTCVLAIEYIHILDDEVLYDRQEFRGKWEKTDDRIHFKISESDYLIRDGDTKDCQVELLFPKAVWYKKRINLNLKVVQEEAK